MWQKKKEQIRCIFRKLVCAKRGRAKPILNYKRCNKQDVYMPRLLQVFFDLNQHHI